MPPVDITVIEDRESVLLSPLVLRKPVNLRVVAEPPTDPWDRTWRATLQAQDSDSYHKGEFTQEGRWQAEDLPAGTYNKLVIENYRRDRLQALDIEVHPGMLDLLVPIPLLRIRGTIKLGNERVGGHLWLTHGTQRIHFPVDQEKGFDAYLPIVQPPSWYPEVRLKGSDGSSLELPSVKVEPAPGLDHAHLGLVLPDTEIRGRVVDADNQPVDRAMTTAVLSGSLGAEQRASSQSDGRFSLRGVAAKLVTVSAEKDSASSDSVVVDLSQGELPTELLLVLKRAFTVTGQVLAPGGHPQPGVRVVLLAITPPGSGPRMFSNPSSKTDLAGVFRNRLPEDIEEVNLAVFSPGFAVRLRQVRVSAEHPLVIQLDQSGDCWSYSSRKTKKQFYNKRADCYAASLPSFPWRSWASGPHPTSLGLWNAWCYR